MKMMRFFSVKIAYDAIHNNISTGNNNFFKAFWEVKESPSAQVLAWRAILDKLPIRLNLVNEGLILPMHCSRCAKYAQNLYNTYFTM